MNLQHYIRLFRHEQLPGDPLTQSRAENITTSGLIAAVAVPAFALLYAGLGLTTGAFGILIAGAGVMAAPLVVRVTGNLGLARETLIVPIFGLITWLLWNLGGISSPPALWVMLCPMIAFMLGSALSGITWSLAALGTLLLSWIADPGISPAFQASEAVRQQLYVISHVGLLSVVIPFFVFFEFSKREKICALETEIENHKRTAGLLDESRQIYSSLFELSPNGVFSLDLEGRISSINQAGHQITGYTIGELQDQEFTMLVHPDDRNHAARMFQNACAGLSENYEIRLRRGSGQTVCVAVTSMPIRLNGTIVGVFNSAQDVTEKRNIQEQLTWLAQYDPLTGLPNRSLFRERLQNAIDRGRRGRDSFALLFVDLDHFKDVNDTSGHATGDAALKVIADRIGSVARKTDTVARLGGDEFTVILEGVESHTEAGAVADKIREQCALPVHADGCDFYLSASIGIALFPADGDNLDALLSKADLAMYEAKQNGRDQIRLLTPELHAGAIERIGTRNDIRHALDRDEFTLRYQPQIDLRSGRITGFEALARWEHPARGAVSPALFIPLLEETGLIVRFGEWTIREICRQIREWDREGVPEFPVAVNISARQLKDPRFAATLETILREERVPCSRIELEITEGILIEDIELSQRVLQHLRNRGFRVALDDFGTGYSSLSYLKDLPLTKLKMDGAFVRHLGLPSTVEPNAHPIARTIISLAHNLNLEVVAEVIETEDQRDWLRRNGCDLAQGYFFSPPVPPEQVPALIDDLNRTAVLTA